MIFLSINGWFVGFRSLTCLFFYSTPLFFFFWGHSPPHPSLERRPKRPIGVAFLLFRPRCEGKGEGKPGKTPGAIPSCWRVFFFFFSGGGGFVFFRKIAVSGKFPDQQKWWRCIFFFRFLDEKLTERFIKFARVCPLHFARRDECRYFLTLPKVSMNLQYFAEPPSFQM